MCTRNFIDMTSTATIGNMLEKDNDPTESRRLVESKQIRASNRVKVNIRCRPILPSDAGTPFLNVYVLISALGFLVEVLVISTPSYENPANFIASDLQIYTFLYNQRKPYVVQ